MSMFKDTWFTELLEGVRHEHCEFDHTREVMDKQHEEWLAGKRWDGTEKQDPMRMIIEPPKLDTTSITDAPVRVMKKFEFRPQEWSQFIGQEVAKDRVKTIKAQFERGMRAHIIMSALKGHGKTSYIELLAKSLGTHLIQRMGNTVTIDVVPEIINEINTTTQRCLLFIDEIDSMDKAMIKLFNGIVESFQISGKQIKPFLFACATINKNILVKNNPDFLDRLQHHINFTRYSVDELTAIITQVYQQLYSEEKISQDQLHELALNCKYNPRTAINLLEFFVVDQNVKNVLKTCGIIKDGLTFTDVKILEFLATQTKPVGSNAIAMKCAMSQREYENEWEGFLFEFGYLDRLPSRKITEKGKELLNSLKTEVVK